MSAAEAVVARVWGEMIAALAAVVVTDVAGAVARDDRSMAKHVVVDVVRNNLPFVFGEYCDGAIGSLGPGTCRLLLKRPLCCGLIVEA